MKHLPIFQDVHGALHLIPIIVPFWQSSTNRIEKVQFVLSSFQTIFATSQKILDKSIICNNDEDMDHFEEKTVLPNYLRYQHHFSVKMPLTRSCSLKMRLLGQPLLDGIDVGLNTFRVLINFLLGHFAHFFWRENSNLSGHHVSKSLDGLQMSEDNDYASQL